MFKNALFFRTGPAWIPNLVLLEEKLGAHTFTPCGPTQPRSVGWVPPRGQEHGALVESVDGQWVLKLLSETKVRPNRFRLRSLHEHWRSAAFNWKSSMEESLGKELTTVAY